MVETKDCLTLDGNSETNIRSQSKNGAEVKEGGYIFGSMFSCNKDTSMTVLVEEERDNETYLAAQERTFAREDNTSQSEYGDERAAKQKSTSEPDVLDAMFDGVESQVCCNREATPNCMEATNEPDLLDVTFEGLESRICGNGETTSEVIHDESKGETTRETTREIVESANAMQHKSSVETDNGRKPANEENDILDHLFEKLEGIVCQDDVSSEKGPFLRCNVDNLQCLMTHSIDSAECAEAVSARNEKVVDVEHGVAMVERGHVTPSNDKLRSKHCPVVVGWTIVLFVGAGFVAFAVVSISKLMS